VLDDRPSARLAQLAAAMEGHIRFHGRGGEGVRIASRIVGRRHLFEPARREDVLRRLQGDVDG